jgi:hypothetical protein
LPLQAKEYPRKGRSLPLPARTQFCRSRKTDGFCKYLIEMVARDATAFPCHATIHWGTLDSHLGPCSKIDPNLPNVKGPVALGLFIRVDRSWRRPVPVLQSGSQSVNR